MTVRELLALLRDADPENIVLFLDDYADLDDSDEVRDVIAPADAWTYESGRCGGREYSVRYPGPFEQRDESYTNVTHTAQRVILLVNGPTNHRRRNLPECTLR